MGGDTGPRNDLRHAIGGAQLVVAAVEATMLRRVLASRAFMADLKNIHCDGGALSRRSGGEEDEAGQFSAGARQLKESKYLQIAADTLITHVCRTELCLTAIFASTSIDLVNVCANVQSSKMRQHLIIGFPPQLHNLSPHNFTIRVVDLASAQYQV